MENINTLIQKVDAVFAESIKAAQADYQTRNEAINSLYEKMTDDLLSIMKTTRSTLVNGALEEARKTRAKQSQKMEAALGEVLSELESMKNHLTEGTNIASVQLLTQKLGEWVNQFERLTIPASKYTKADNYSAPLNLQKSLNDWLKFCLTNPIIQHSALYEQKSKLNENISQLNKKISALEDAIEREKAELEDRTQNGTRYENDVRNQVDFELDDADTEIRRSKQNISDQENRLSSLQQQLAGLGPLSFGKKKEVRAQIESATQSLAETKTNASMLEEKKKSIQGSLESRLKALEEAIVLLTDKIKADEAALIKAKSDKEAAVKELNVVESKISHL